MRRRILQTALDVLYPPRCISCRADVHDTGGLCGSCWRDTPFIGSSVCVSCGVPLPGEEQAQGAHCDDCMTHPKPWQNGRAVFIYKDIARHLVLGLKHNDDVDLARPAGCWLSQVAEPLMQPDTVIVPIPLHWRRMVRRRYNQAALLARAMARCSGHEACLDLLRRPAATPKLDGMSRTERAQTLKAAIDVNPRRAPRMVGRPILLVDDVLTTGATLGAATNVCLRAGTGPVSVVVLARAVYDQG